MGTKIKKGDKSVQRAWTFYDWANSVYPLVISTAIFPIFYEKTTAAIGTGPMGDEVTFFGQQIKNTVLYSYVIAASFVAVIIISPILSGIADYVGSKKRYLQFFCYLGATATASLYFFDAEHALELSMLSLFLASLGFWNSLVFYNAYLPEIAAPEEQDKLSAKGFSMGYIGSVILLVTSLVLIKAFNVPAKYCFVLTGIWWAGFAQVTYRKLPKANKRQKVVNGLLSNGFRELKKVGKFTWKTVRLKRYIIAFFFLSMGVQTVMLMAVLFAKKEIFNKPDSNEAGLIIAVLIIQFVAVLGAFVFSASSKRFGNIKTLGGALFIWVLCCTAAYKIVDSETGFYILAASVGLVMGGTQALSRSTFSKFLPQTKDTASFFSFYDITEKLGIVLGMVTFGALEAIFGDIRTSVLSLITFFVLGLIALFFVPKNEAEHVNMVLDEFEPEEEHGEEDILDDGTLAQSI
ncbi:MFS transporter [Paracrocinitomix mangrovi]|uniref:MFS transporter n=1 Tax=Paracrocinitomix mangrovi TaxID=2862509 RepID=UPI001C8D0151|nr:MFS transporter [Paracrocinitomix mangrovi]UKN02848.1 MFS transporter [Paracrocinitomix mangrovi]